MANAKPLLEYFRRQYIFRLIDFFIDNPGKDFSKLDIAKGTGLSRATIFNHWNIIEKAGIVKVSRRFGRTKLYTLDTKNIVLKRLLEFESFLISEVVGKK